MVTVKFFGYLREKAGKKSIEIHRVKNLKSLFNEVKRLLGDKFIHYIFNDLEKFDLKRDIIILVNGKTVNDPNKELAYEDIVAIMPFLGGGKKIKNFKEFNFFFESRIGLLLQL